jgi:hypothetical protein
VKLLQCRMPTTKFDVFLSHKSSDKPAVEELARRLVKEGIEPWLDKWNLIPGDPWQVAIEDALLNCPTCAVFIGPSGIGPWHNEEMRAAISRRVSESQGSFRVIPVLLPGATREERSKLPTFLTTTMWVEFRQSLDEEEAFHRLLCGIRGIAPGPGPGEAVYEGVCPYRGLQVFDVEHAPFFFGREALLEWLLKALRPTNTGQENRFLGIIGASGSGKSSLARAGLIAALKHGKLPGSDAWSIAIFRPGENPLENLAVALANVKTMTESEVSQLQENCAKRENCLHLTTRLALQNMPPDRRVVILVDQFEEVFTLCQNETLRKGLIDNLIYAATVAEGKTIVILTLRADFYGKCAAYPTLAAALSDQQILVGGMTDEELRLAIERPAQVAGAEFEPGLVDLLLKDMHAQAGGLPLLQYALLELWNQRAGRRLTVAAYQMIGGVEGALEQRAETVFQGFTEAEQQFCRQIFLRLTQTGEGVEATKRRVVMIELLPAQGNPEQIEAVAQRLSVADARLITIEGRGLDAGERVIEVAHEALIRGWKRLQGWLNADREFLLWRQRLRASVEEWKRTNHDESVLLRGGLLAEAERWLQERPADLSADEQQFIQASSDLRQLEHAARERGRRRKLMALTTGLIITLALSIVAGIFWYRAEVLHQEAERQSLISTAKSLVLMAKEKTQNGERRPAALLTRQAYILNQNNKGDINKQIDDTLRLILLTREGTTAELVEKVCPQAGRDLTPEEWQQAAGSDISYQYQPCPVLADLKGGAEFVLHLRDEKTTADKNKELSLNLRADSRPETKIANNYEDKGDVIVDHATGLMWQKSTSPGPLPYPEAQAYVKTLTFAGCHDWRLPTIEELLSLLETTIHKENNLCLSPMFDAQEPKIGDQLWNTVWSADTRKADESYPESAWVVDFYFGYVTGWTSVKNSSYVRAVRSVQ